MNTARLDAWQATGAISQAQHATLTAIVRKDLFSVFLELNTLLYLGVVSFAVGLGWTVYTRVPTLGDAAIVLPLLLLLSASFWYGFTHAQPYSVERVDSQGFAFDYVLYLGCLVFGVTLGYLEFRFRLLGENWDYHLLVSAILYFALAYRFDNRFVLALALSTLGAWFGFRLSLLGFHLAGSERADALAYAVIVAVVGLVVARRGIKRHFLESYLHVAANAGLAAMTSGVMRGDAPSLWLLGLIAACATAIERGLHTRRFAFVAYGTIYGYVGVSARLLANARDFTFVLAYVVVSAVAVVGGLVVAARRMGREE